MQSRELHLSHGQYGLARQKRKLGIGVRYFRAGVGEKHTGTDSGEAEEKDGKKGFWYPAVPRWDQQREVRNGLRPVPMTIHVKRPKGERT